MLLRRILECQVQIDIPKRQGHTDPVQRQSGVQRVELIVDPIGAGIGPAPQQDTRPVGVDEDNVPQRRQALQGRQGPPLSLGPKAKMRLIKMRSWRCLAPAIISTGVPDTNSQRPGCSWRQSRNWSAFMSFLTTFIDLF